jgi:hypothetical protein
MTDPRFHRLLGTADHDPGCDAGLDVIDVYCEAVLRGDVDSDRFRDFLTHLGNCTTCREDTESLLAVLRELGDQESSSERSDEQSGKG